MENLIPWGLSVVQWIQSFRNPILDSFFLTINYFGEAYFFLAVIPLLYWCVQKQIGFRFALLVAFSTYLNLLLKDFFAAPRPYQIDVNLYAPAKESTYGIPSFHAQQTTLAWGYIAMQFGRVVGRRGKILLWTLAVMIPLLVSIGRMYVSAHFPQDVIAGAGIGLALLVVYAACETRIGNWLKAHATLATKIAIAIVMPIALAGIHFTLDTAINLGTLMGFAVGLVLEEEFVQFDTRGVAWQQLGKILIGGAVLVGLQQGLKLLLPEAGLTNFVRYSIVGLWLGAGAPWVFVKARLAGRQTPTHG